MSGRDAVADDHRQAVKASIQKRRNIEKLKSASSLRSDKVNEALEDLDEVRLRAHVPVSVSRESSAPLTEFKTGACAQAQHYEETLARRLQGISTNLQPSLTRHSIDTHADLLQSLLEHARTTLIYEKQRLKEYENLRPEMRAIRKPEAGVIYHTAPAAAAMGRQGSGVSSVASNGTATSSSAGGPPLSASTYGGAAPGTPTTASLPGHDPLLPPAEQHVRPSTMAQKVQKRTIRNMASSVHVEGDKRQRVDVSASLTPIFFPFL